MLNTFFTIYSNLQFFSFQWSQSIIIMDLIILSRIFRLLPSPTLTQEPNVLLTATYKSCCKTLHHIVISSSVSSARSSKMENKVKKFRKKVTRSALTETDHNHTSDGQMFELNPYTSITVDQLNPLFVLFYTSFVLFCMLHGICFTIGAIQSAVSVYHPLGHFSKFTAVLS